MGSPLTKLTITVRPVRTYANDSVTAMSQLLKGAL
jgi:hypothetical protein